MDPNATLEEMRAFVKKVLYSVDSAATDDETRMAELFESLDEWITKGGFLPNAWTFVNLR